MTPVRAARSSNWRVNSSSIKSVEGAYILRALRKVAGAVGLPAGYQVKFNTGEAVINLDPEYEDIMIQAGDLFTKAPMPPENMDVLVGRTLHEVEHHNINTKGVWLGCHYKVSRDEREFFQSFVSIGEDIIVDKHLLANQNLMDYYVAALERAFRGWHGPHMNSLLELWIEYAIIGNRDIILYVPDALVEPMQQLTELTEKLKEPMDRLVGTRLRGEYYVTYWNLVKEVVIHPPELEQLPGAGGGGLPGEETKGENPDQKGGRTQVGPTSQDHPGFHEDVMPPMSANSAPLDKKLAEQIEEAVMSETEDITDQVYSEFTEAGLKAKGIRFMITRKRETKNIIVKPDPEQCRRLERILAIRKRLQDRVMRGEEAGKLDMRKLHRSQTDRKMFKLKYRFPDGFPDTAILIDMSGSMSGKQAEEVITAATSLANVVKCKVWSYAENGSEIRLVKLDEGKVTHGALPGGNTPSGIALVGVADTLKKGGLIIHLTDGEHNVEFGPVEATAVLRKKGINAVHLLWGQTEGPYTGLPCQVLRGGISEFPEALYQILIEQLKLVGLSNRK